MSYQNEPQTGVLFPNDKEGKPNRPDYKGTYYERVGDAVVEREIAAWERTAKASGKRYLSIRVRDKFVPAQKAEVKQDGTPFNDEVPF